MRERCVELCLVERWRCVCVCVCRGAGLCMLASASHACELCLEFRNGKYINQILMQSIVNVNHPKKRTLIQGMKNRAAVRMIVKLLVVPV